MPIKSSVNLSVLAGLVETTALSYLAKKCHSEEGPK